MVVPVRGGDGHQAVNSEWLRHGDKVSDGDHGISIRVDRERGLDVLNRPEGRLLPDSCPSRMSNVSSLLSRWTGLSVPCIVLRSVHDTAGVHQSLHSGFRVGVSKGSAFTPFSEQLAGHCGIVGSAAALGAGSPIM